MSLLPLPAAQAATTDIVGAALPSARDGTSAVGADGSVYIFGGDLGGSRTAEILRYEPQTDSLSVAGALPSPRSGTSAIWDGQHAYIFGGWGDSFLKQIVRYDPATGAAQVMGATLPTPRYATSAVWDGQFAYVFGGSSGGATLDQIVRYDPATDTATLLTATLPADVYATSAVWDGQYAYVFGGYSQSTATKHDQIVRFDPSTGTTSVLALTLPAARYHTSAVFIGGQAHVFGGYTAGGSLSDAIYDLDLDAGTASTNTTALSSARALTSATTVGRYAYIIGGDLSGTKSDDILRHGPLVPNTAPVLDAVADATVQATQAINLTFSASDADHEPLTLSLSPLPAGAAFSDNGDGTAALDWTPTRGQAGLFTVTITATDGTASDAATFDINVTEAPDTPPVITAIGNQTVVAEESLSIAVEAADPDGDALTLAHSGPNGTSLTDNGNGTGTLSWTPTLAQVGNHTVTVSATANGTTDSTAFTIRVVSPGNRAPVFDGLTTPEVLYVGDVLNQTFRATDADNDTLVLTLSPLPSNATFEDRGDGRGHFNWTVSEAHEGVHAFTVSASDGVNVTEVPFEITVHSGLEPVIAALVDLNATEGDSIGFLINATDPQGLPLALTLDPQPLPFGASFVDGGDGSGAFTWDISYGAAGLHAFTVTADNGDRSTTATFTISVTNVDRAPVFDSALDTQRVVLGSDLALVVAASDPDGSAVTIGATGVPTGATFTDHGDGTATLQWDDVAPVGVYTLSLVAVSNGESVEGTQRIEVVRAYDAALSTANSILDVTPNVTVPVQFVVRNTGFNDDTFSISVADVSPSPQGFGVSQPTPVSVPAGESRTVTFDVAVPADGTSARLRAEVTSAGDAALLKTIAWIVRVPVFISVEVDPDPAVVGPNGTMTLEGRVVLSWADGSPAQGLAFDGVHAYPVDGRALDAVSGTTNDDGEWRFDAESQPTFALPGQHHLDISVTRGLRTDTGSGSWSVAPVGVPGL